MSGFRTPRMLALAEGLRMVAKVFCLPSRQRREGYSLYMAMISSASVSSSFTVASFTAEGMVTW